MSSVAPQKVLDPRQFSSWSQQDWQEFVQSPAAKDRSDPNRNELLLHPSVQQALLEVGVCGGSEFFRRLPTVFMGACPTMEDHLNVYPISRMLIHTKFSTTKLVCCQNVENTCIVIIEDIHKSSWKIILPRVRGTHEESFLVHSHEIFAQMTAVVNIGKVAKEILGITLPQPVTHLALEYAGYPQKPRKRIEKMQELLFDDLANRDVRQEADLRDLNKIKRFQDFEGIAALITRFLGEDDRDEVTNL